MLSLKNFGIRFRVKCLDYTLLAILILFRTLLVAYSFVFICPDIWKSIVMTWNLNKENTWKSEDEPFLTNASLVNAFICWMYWFIYIWSIYFFIYILPLIFICVVSSQVKRIGIPATLKNMGSLLCVILDFLIIKYIGNFILGRSIDQLVGIAMRFAG